MASSSSAMEAIVLISSSSSSPCAACKFLRRKCIQGCVFAPHFPSDNPQKFANIHKIFGASNVSKLLNELPPYQREDAVKSLAYEADARMNDPVYGCVGAITVLHRKVQQLQMELDVAKAELMRYVCCMNIDIPAAGGNMPAPSMPAMAAVPPFRPPPDDLECMNVNGGTHYQQVYYLPSTHSSRGSNARDLNGTNMAHSLC